MLIAKYDVAMREITNGLNSRPTGRRRPEQTPRQIQHSIAIAKAAGQKEYERLLRKFLNGNLSRIGRDRIGRAFVGNDGV
jgi:hypothetical protein